MVSSGRILIASVLTTITFILLFVGTIAFFEHYIGWAQVAWVVASGTSGAAATLWIEQILIRRET